MNINGKNIVITGANSGIGLAVTQLLLKYDCKIIGADIKTDALTGLIPQVIPFKGDLSTREANDELFEFAQERFGKIDVFFANAGFAYYEKIDKADWQRMEKIFAVNVFAPLYAVKKMKMLYAEAPYRVLITASAMSHVGLPGYSLYSATKSAIHRFADTYRYEMPEDGHLTVIYPIATRSNFFDHKTHTAPIPFPSQSVEFVAHKIVKGIRDDAKSIYPSRLFQIYHFLSRFIPFIIPIMQKYEQIRLNKWVNALK